MHAHTVWIRAMKFGMIILYGYGENFLVKCTPYLRIDQGTTFLHICYIVHIYTNHLTKSHQIWHDNPSWEENSVGQLPNPLGPFWKVQADW